MKKPTLLFFFCFFSMACYPVFAQKEKDHRKENFKSTGRPGDKYTYTPGTERFNPETGKREASEGEWKKQPDEYSFDPKKWSKAKHKKSIYGKNPIKRLFKIKPKSAKPDAAPSDKEEKRDKPFTTGEEKEKKK